MYYKLQNRPKTDYKIDSAEKVPLKMAHSVPQHMGVTSPLTLLAKKKLTYRYSISHNCQRTVPLKGILLNF